MHPLYDVLRGRKPTHVVDSSTEDDTAFTAAKAALGSGTMLAQLSPDAPIAIITDSSDYAVGAVHEQWIDATWQPLAFFSRQLHPAKRQYSTFDWELLPS